MTPTLTNQFSNQNYTSFIQLKRSTDIYIKQWSIGKISTVIFSGHRERWQMGFPLGWFFDHADKMSACGLRLTSLVICSMMMLWILNIHRQTSNMMWTYARRSPPLGWRQYPRLWLTRLPWTLSGPGFIQGLGAMGILTSALQWFQLHVSTFIVEPCLIVLWSIRPLNPNSPRPHVLISSLPSGPVRPVWCWWFF